MGKVTGKLTVFFENPFWVGAFERIEDGRISASKVIFGAEPRDCEVYEWVLKHSADLKFSPTAAVVIKEERRNPKRLQREVKHQCIGIGTKAQQALKLQQEQHKTERKEKRRAQKEQEQQYKFERKQQKKKEKHRGR